MSSLPEMKAGGGGAPYLSPPSLWRQIRLFVYITATQGQPQSFWQKFFYDSRASKSEEVFIGLEFWILFYGLTFNAFFLYSGMT